MYPMPALEDLDKAREEYFGEFQKIETRDVFYWSATKLVSAVVDGDTENVKFDELVSALMMLLKTWNKNFYRFFANRKPRMTMEEHFTNLETIIRKHFATLIELRRQT